LAAERPVRHKEITMTTAAAVSAAHNQSIDPTLEQNKAAARRVLEEIFPANDTAALRDVLDEDVVNHEAPPGTPRGIGSVAMFMGMLAKAFSDQHWTIQQVIAEGDLVAIHCVHTGRHTGAFFGVPPTGRSFAYEQIHLIKMRNGKGVEQWGVRDDATLMRQLTAAD
jgi:predicted ester cyclase